MMVVYDYNIDSNVIYDACKRSNIAYHTGLVLCIVLFIRHSRVHFILMIKFLIDFVIYSVSIAPSVFIKDSARLGESDDTEAIL